MIQERRLNEPTTASTAMQQPVHSRWWYFARRHKINSGLLFVLPAVAFYLFYVVWPLVSMFQYSFYQWDGISPTKTFVGFGNYVQLLTRDRAFRLSIANNLIWAAVTIGVLLIVGFLVAYALNQPLRLRNVFRTLFFIPTTASLVVIGYIWSFIYDGKFGPLNVGLRTLGLGALARTWLADPQVTLFAVIAVAVWASLGFYVVVYLAAIQSISKDLFDSAAIDGANGLQKMWFIAIPLSSATTRALVILGLVGAVNQFGFVFLLSKGGPYHASETMAYQIYDLAFALNQTGYASTLSVVLLLISAIITIAQLLLVRRGFRMFG